jgi:hypothetical protein
MLITTSKEVLALADFAASAHSLEKRTIFPEIILMPLPPKT